jgi:hypothetical protein
MTLYLLCCGSLSMKPWSTSLRAKLVLGFSHTVADCDLIAQALIRFPREGAEDLKTWLMRSHWQLRIMGKCTSEIFCCSGCPCAEDTFHIARVDYQIFERISSYDVKREYGILARRKSKNTTNWLRSNGTFKAWLEDSNPTHDFWISGKGTCPPYKTSPATDTLFRSWFWEECIDVRSCHSISRTTTD